MKLAKSLFVGMSTGFAAFALLQFEASKSTATEDVAAVPQREVKRVNVGAIFECVETELRQGDLERAVSSVADLEVAIGTQAPVGHEDDRKLCDEVRQLAAGSAELQLKVKRAHAKLSGAIACENAGAIDKATLAAGESYGLMRDALGTDCEIVDRVRVTYLAYLIELGLFDSCERSLNACLTYRRGAFGENSLPYADALRIEAMTRAGKGDVDTAAKHIRKALELRRSSSQGSRKFVRDLILLAGFNCRLGRHEKAIGLIALSQKLTQTSGLGELNTAIAASAQAEASYGYGATADAFKQADVALMAIRLFAPAGTSETIRILEQKARFARILGETKVVEELEKESAGIRRRIEKQREAVNGLLIE